MGKKEGPCYRSQKSSLGLTRALTLAVSEWMLMFMLFIDACFSYLVTRFAWYCELQVPCPVCSRLDHVLTEKKTGVYWDLMCGNHKLEISSLVHGMCDRCLFAFATTNKSNAENYRVLVGKMGSIPHAEEYDLGTSGTRICSCCNERWISRGHPQNLLSNTSVGSEAAELDKSSSLKVDHSRNDQKTIMDEAPAPNRSSLVEKVQLSSDPESELLLSNHDIASASISASASALIRERNFPMDQSLQEISNLHGCEELKRKQDEHRENISTTAELISFDEVSPSPHITETTPEVSVHSYAPGSVEVESSVTTSVVMPKAESEPTVITERSIDMNSVVTTNGLQMSNSLDLGDAYKLATIGSKGRQLSGKLVEQRSLNGSKRVSEDLKLLLSQLSFSRGLELSLNDMMSPNPKVTWNGDEVNSLDTNSSIGMQLLQRRISLERNESGLSLDGSTVSDIDGESVVDRLKRQVKHDKKLMNALYKELEEERNASAVATYQAMAMITRLQEEKATLHMEALQCLRVMEEQAEYDGEALQRANDLLAKKEKELLDMRTELQLYQKTSTDL